MPVKNIRILSWFFVLLSVVLFARRSRKNDENTGWRSKKPRLVVGIVIDQMRYDYLYRYWNKYGNGGFKRLLREGTYAPVSIADIAPTIAAFLQVQQPGGCTGKPISGLSR
jgi:predicted AlkP superfamily pyrophosphatase or phosphodiesterase